MATNMEHGKRRNAWRLPVWGAAACLLLLPWVGMQFTQEVNWTASDFITFGTMLFLACGTYELATWMTSNTAYRAGVGVAVAAAFFLVWVTLAVGIIGSEHDRANLMFGGVLAVGIIGSCVARFRPQGMVRALVATAVAQASVAVVVLVAALGSNREVLGLTGVFVALWLASAWLFRKSA